MLKPDVVGRGDHFVIRQRILDAGFIIIAEKNMQLTASKAQDFYAEHRGKPFFDGLVRFMSSGPLVCSVIRL